MSKTTKRARVSSSSNNTNNNTTITQRNGAFLEGMPNTMVASVLEFVEIRDRVCFAITNKGLRGRAASWIAQLSQTLVLRGGLGSSRDQDAGGVGDGGAGTRVMMQSDAWAPWVQCPRVTRLVVHGRLSPKLFAWLPDMRLLTHLELNLDHEVVGLLQQVLSGLPRLEHLVMEHHPPRTRALYSMSDLLFAIANRHMGTRASATSDSDAIVRPKVSLLKTLRVQDVTGSVVRSDWEPRIPAARPWLQQLTSLALTIGGLDESWLVSLHGACPRLTTLHLRAEPISSLWTSPVPWSRYWPAMQDIALNVSSVLRQQSALLSIPWLNIAQGCKALHHLRIQIHAFVLYNEPASAACWCDGLRTLLPQCPSMQTLVLRPGFSIQPELVDALNVHCPHLERLIVTPAGGRNKRNGDHKSDDNAWSDACSERTMLALATHHPHLHEFPALPPRMPSTDWLTDFARVPWTDLQVLHVRCPATLEGMSTSAAHTPNAHEQACAALIQATPRMRKLQLVMETCTSTFYRALAPVSPSPHLHPPQRAWTRLVRPLTHLVLHARFASLTPDDVTLIRHHCPMLVQLGISCSSCWAELPASLVASRGNKDTRGASVWDLVLLAQECKHLQQLRSNVAMYHVDAPFVQALLAIDTLSTCVLRIGSWKDHDDLHPTVTNLTQRGLVHVEHNENRTQRWWVVRKGPSVVARLE